MASWCYNPFKAFLVRRELSLRSSPSSGEVSTHSPACTSSPGLKRALDFKEEEQASGSNEKKMILAVEDDTVTLSEDSGEKASTPEVHSVTYEGDWEELRRTLPDLEDPLVAMDINPASSYQEEPVSSKDSTCSCNSSLQILAACFTCCVVRV